MNKDKKKYCATTRKLIKAIKAKDKWFREWDLSKPARITLGGFDEEYQELGFAVEFGQVKPAEC